MNMTADMNMNMIITYKKHDNAGNIDDDGDHEYFFLRDSRTYHYDGTTPVTTFILLYCNHH